MQTEDEPLEKENIRLRTSKLRASNFEVLLGTGFNTFFYCVGWIAWDGGIENATMSIVTENLNLDKYLQHVINSISMKALTSSKNCKPIRLEDQREQGKR